MFNTDKNRLCWFFIIGPSSYIFLFFFQMISIHDLQKTNDLPPDEKGGLDRGDFRRRPRETRPVDIDRGDSIDAGSRRNTLRGPRVGSAFRLSLIRLRTSSAWLIANILCAVNKSDSDYHLSSVINHAAYTPNAGAKEVFRRGELWKELPSGCIDDAGMEETLVCAGKGQRCIPACDIGPNEGPHTKRVPFS